MTSNYTPTSAFETARRNIDGLKSSNGSAQSPDRSESLLAYCLFKQTRDGDAAGTKAAFNFYERTKFNAWTLVRGMARAEADARYVNCAEYLVGGRELSEENKELLAKINGLFLF